MSLIHFHLRERFAQQRRERGRRQRDIALALGVSEGELVAAHVGSDDREDASPMQVQRLDADWPALIGELEQVGEVMALTRNEHCVHETVGRYGNASAEGAMGLVLGEGIDLRVFYRHWKHGFAVAEHTAKGLSCSLQFFDGAGAAIHKVHLRPATDHQAWEALVARWSAAHQFVGIEVEPAAPAQAETPDGDIDIAGLRADWAALRDTHEFFALLRRHGVSRTQALRLADPRFVQPVAADSASRLLEAAALGGEPIMVFAGNPGMLQIHTGAVRKVARTGPWINVLDARFNLHLREDGVQSAWIVRKPTDDGLVSSLELFDAAGTTVAMFFGERKPGKAEREDWRDLLAQLDVAATEAVDA